MGAILNAPALIQHSKIEYFGALLIGISVMLFSQACTTVTHREYKPLIKVLNDKSELKVSAYPAWFPRKVRPRKLKTHGEVYFQFYAKNRQRAAEPPANVEMIEFHSFAYRMNDGPRVVLLPDYPRSFWMQNNPNYESRDPPPIPYQPNSRITVEVELTLNGKRHSLQGVMPSANAGSPRPMR